MTDIFSTCPSLPTGPFSHLIPSLERHSISVSDLLTLDPLDVARHAQLPPKEVRRLTDCILGHLQAELGISEEEAQGDEPAGSDSNNVPRELASLKSVSSDGVYSSGSTISLLSPGLDEALAGGIRTSALTEITGESSTAKTQFLLTLLLAVQLPVSLGGLGRSAMYISTESSLATSRLSQMLSSHPVLAQLEPKHKPTLARILSTTVPDLEAQQHILQYQLPVAVRRHDIGLVVIDSITANYRAEVERTPDAATGRGGSSAMANRAASLQSTGHLLRTLAHRHNLAVVVANQVADRFERSFSSGLAADGLPPGSMESDDGLIEDMAMNLDQQQRFFTGWGDYPNPYGGLKTPSLGLVWSNQLDCRIALLRAPRTGPNKKPPSAQATQKPRWRRWMKIAFATSAEDHSEQRGVEFEISAAGVLAIGDSEAHTISTSTTSDAQPSGRPVADQAL